MRRRIVGTAGHIDHGKTSLIRALTGIDTDRLPEEKKRGITIDLGFARLQEGETQIGFVDVPGHERFVRNMLAGVGGIDSVLLVVAADESIKPQTREHLAICSLLRLRTGVVALTKADAVDPDILELVRLEVEDLVRGTFLEGKRVIATSAVTGAGLPELRAALVASLEESEERDVEGRVYRLPIDRVFTMKGFGTVVTGTSVSGTLRAEDDVVVLPGDLRSRARNIQVHGEPRREALAGERTSVNLADLAVDALERGQQVVPPDTLEPSLVITCEIHLLEGAPPLKDQSRIRFHHFSSELLGKVRLLHHTAIEPGTSAFAQIRLESPVVAVGGDRFVLRRYSPQITIGGGTILDPHLGRLSRGTREGILARLRDGSLPERVELMARLAGPAGITMPQMRSRTGLTLERLESELASSVPHAVQIGEGNARRWMHEDVLRDLRSAAMETLTSFFEKNRTALGMPKSELLQRLHVARLDASIVAFVLRDLATERIAQVEGDLVHVPGRSRTLGGAEGELARLLESRFKDAGMMPPAISELINTIQQRPKLIEGVVGYLAKSGTLVRLAENVYLHRDVLAEARVRLASHAGETQDVAWFKDFYGISRKIVIPLLEHFDRAGVTKRVGDRRRIEAQAE